MSKARCILWIDPQQIPLFKRVLSRADIELVGAGSPESGRTGQIASDLSTTPIDDLRHAMSSAESDLIILGNPASFAEHALDADLDALKAAQSRNLCVATLEPIPGAAAEIAGTSFADAMTTGALNELSRFVPMMRHTPMIAELHNVLETFIPIRSMTITMGAPKVYGSLGARLFDAMDLVRSLMGMPNIIESGFISPAAGRGLHPLPGHSLRNLHGEFSMNLRFSDGRCATVFLTDQVGSSIYSMTILGREGHIVADQSGFVWCNPDGDKIDSYTCNHEKGIDPAEIALADQLIELCAGVGPIRNPIDYSSVLSMTHATLLSTRTGQGESPRAVEQLLLSM